MRNCILLSIVVFVFLRSPIAATGTSPALDQQLIEETVRIVGSTIRKEYFDADVASRVDDSLQKWKMEGRYAEQSTFESFSAKLTADLFELTHDKHLAVSVVRTPIAPGSEAQSRDRERQEVGKRSNFGVQRIEILSGNVGYLNLTAFYRPEEARDVIASAMQTVRNADALILDLRDNGGGSPDTVALVASYFFDEQDKPLFEIAPRSGEPRQYTTASDGVDDRNGKRAMYVLISARTFSGGEGMAFLLQEQKRAEIIGETTAGAANPGRPYPVGTHFEVTVPNGKVRSSIRASNWEGHGVTPDVEVTAADALSVAHLRALRELIKHEEGGEWLDTLERVVKELEEARQRLQ
jgi:C-terminal processing protease CtpA/Prc